MIRVASLTTPGWEFAPLLAPSWQYRRDVRTGVMQPIDNDVPYVTLRRADTRAGQLEFLFRDRATAERAEEILGNGDRFELVNTDAVDGPIRDVVTNVVPNGNGAAVSGTRTLRTNLIHNPSATGGTTAGWVAHSSVLLEASPHPIPDVPDAQFFRMTIASTSTGDLAQRVDLASTGIPPITAGQTYAISAYMRTASSARTGDMRCYWLDSTGAQVGPSFGPGQYAGASTSRRSIVATAPAGAVRLIIRFGTLNGGTVTWQAGDVLDFGAVLVEELAEVRPYFDGDTTPEPDLYTAWDGTAYASTSRLLGYVPRLWRSSTPTAVVTRVEADGSTSIEARRVGSGGSLYVDPWVNFNPAHGAAAGQWIAFGVDVRGLDDYTANNMVMRLRAYDGASYDGGGGVDWPAPVTSTGFTRIMHAARISAMPAGAYLRTLLWPDGASTAGFRFGRASVAFADTEAEALAAVADWFDGSNPPRNAAGTVEWDGVPFESSSTFTPAGTDRFRFVVTGGLDVVRNMPGRSWMLRAGFREVY